MASGVWDAWVVEKGESWGFSRPWSSRSAWSSVNRLQISSISIVVAQLANSLVNTSKQVLGKTAHLAINPSRAMTRAAGSKCAGLRLRGNNPKKRQFLHVPVFVFSTKAGSRGSGSRDLERRLCLKSRMTSRACRAELVLSDRARFTKDDIDVAQSQSADGDCGKRTTGRCAR